MLTDEQYKQLFGSDGDAAMPPAQKRTGAIPAQKQPAPVQPQEEKSFLGKVADIGKGLISGPLKEVENVVQSGHDIANLVDDKLFGDKYINNDTDVDYVPDVIKPETGMGKTAQSLSAFAAGWFTGGRYINTAVKGAKVMQTLSQASPFAAQMVSTAVSGGLIDFVSGDGTESRLADTLVENDVMRNGLTEYLASNPDDSRAEARFKNVLEGFLTGAALEGVGRAFKALKSGVKASMSGSLEGALNARKGLQETAVTQAEQVIKEATKKGIWAKGEMTLTPQARAYYMGQEAITDLTGLAKRARDMIKTTTDGLNLTHFDEAAKVILEPMNYMAAEAAEKNHMSMTTLAADALDFLVDNKADIATDPKGFLTAAQTADQRVGQAAKQMYLNWFTPRQIQQQTQRVAEGIAGSEDTLRSLMADTADLLVDTKLTGQFHGQVGKAMDVIRIFSEGQGAFKSAVKGMKKSANTLGHGLTYGEMQTLVRDNIQNLSKDELLQMANYVAMTAPTGKISDAFKAVALISDKTSPLRELLPNGHSAIWDGVMKWRYASMLSGIRTAERNFIGNSLKTGVVAFEESVKAVVAGGMEGYTKDGLSGMGIGALNGAKNGAYFGQGLKYSLGHAWEMFQNSFKYGKSFSRSSEFTQMLTDAGSENVGISWKNAWETPMRALTACDDFFSALVGGAKAYQDARISLNQSGVLNGITDVFTCSQITDKWLDDAMTKAFTPITAADGTVIKQGAIAFKEMLDVADEATFQQTLDGVFKTLYNAANQHPALKLIFPFIKTPTNLFKDVFYTRGIHVPKELYTAAKSQDPKQISDAVAHMTTAAALWLTSYNLVMDGKVTGKGPQNKNQMNALRENGYQPSSLHLGDSYVPLTSIAPFGTAMEFLATAHETAQREGSEFFTMEMGEITFNTLMKIAADKTFLKGFSDLMNSINDEKALDAKGFTSQTLLSFAPSLFKEIGQSLDPIIYEANTFTDKLLNKIGMTENLAPKISWVSGQERIYSYGGGLGPWDPFATSEDKGSIVFDALSKAEGIAEPSKNIGSRELSDFEYAAYCKQIGTTKIDGLTLYEALDAFTRSKEFQNYPDPTPFSLAEAKNRELRRITDRYKDSAKREFLRRTRGVIDEKEAQNDLFASITDA